MNPRSNPLRRLVVASLLAASLPRAQAHPDASTDASSLSSLPIAVSVAVPVTLLSAGAVLTVVSVEASADGTVWVLERASDGAHASLRLSAKAGEGASIAAGTAVVVTTFSAGCVLSAAGRALAYIPNRVGEALLYDERVSS